MKKILLLLMFTLPAKAVVINPQLIDGFAYIESNFNDKAIGKAGEKGAWQFGKAAWADCNAERIKMGKPVYHWSKAHDRRIASDYAHLYLCLIHGRLWKALDREPSVGELYAAYNCGVNGFANGHDGKISKCPVTTQNAISKLIKYLK